MKCLFEDTAFAFSCPFCSQMQPKSIVSADFLEEIKEKRPLNTIKDYYDELDEDALDEFINAGPDDEDYADAISNLLSKKPRPPGKPVESKAVVSPQPRTASRHLRPQIQSTYGPKTAPEESHRTSRPRPPPPPATYRYISLK